MKHAERSVNRVLKGRLGDYATPEGVILGWTPRAPPHIPERVGS